MTDLAHKKCIPCEGGTPPPSLEREKIYLDQLKGWNLIVDDVHRIKKKFYFDDFEQSVAFVNKIAKI